jgi:biopolymer transport protein ExbB
MFGEMSLVGFLLASPTMIVLALCSIVTLGFTIERILYFKSSSTDSRSVMGELARHIKAGNPQAALDYCTAQKNPVSRVMAQGVMQLNRNRDELQQRLDTAIDLETVEMERNLGVLGTMSNIAPLLGLFGTVIGIIRAFADIARTGSGGGAVVAMGVSEALMTTAAGIVVAVIATVAFNFFVRKIRTRTAHLEDARESFFTIWHQYHKQMRQAAANKQSQQAAPRQQTRNAQPTQQAAPQIEEALSTVLS